MQRVNLLEVSGRNITVQDGQDTIRYTTCRPLDVRPQLEFTSESPSSLKVEAVDLPIYQFREYGAGPDALIALGPRLYDALMERVRADARRDVNRCNEDWHHKLDRALYLAAEAHRDTKAHYNALLRDYTALEDHLRALHRAPWYKRVLYAVNPTRLKLGGH